MKTTPKLTGLKNNQKGVISIITVMLLSIILILITTSFVKATTSNLRQSLDNQLTTQAFYAAESGVNDVLNVMNSGGSITNLNEYDDCNSVINGSIRTMYGLPVGQEVNALDVNTPVEYSCVFVSSEAPNIIFEPGSNGKVYLIKSASSADSEVITSINITWGKDGQLVPIPSAGLPTQGAWGNNRLSMLRITFYYPPLLQLSRSSLIQAQKTLFLKPVGSGGTNLINAQSSSDGEVVNVNCSAGSCSLSINGVPYYNNDINNIKQGFYIRVVPIYNLDTSVTIEAFHGGPPSLNLAGAQYIIDSTGRANDVYRRMEYRLPYDTQYEFPTSVVTSGSGDLCKQFVAWPGGTNDEAPSGCSLSP